MVSNCYPGVIRAHGTEKNINAVTRADAPCDRLDCDGRLITIFIGCRIIKERELKAKLKKEKEEVKS